MATPVWNQLAAPNYSAANGLIAQAMSQLTKAGEGLQGVAKEYKDTIQNRNLGLIQEYINSAKTPEELQSEGFQTGLAKLTENMRGEYDTSAKAQLVNKATDTLLSRKANQVSIARNEFGLTQDQLTAKKTENAAKLFALRNDPLAYKAEEQRQVAEGALDINAAQSIPLNVLNLDNATIDNRVKRESADSIIASALLDPTVKQTGIDTALGNLEVARQNAKTNRLQAEAAAARAAEEKNKNKNAYIGTAFAAIDNARKDVKEKIYGSGLNTDPEKSFKKWEEKTTAGLLNFDPAPNKVVELIDGHPELRELPDNLKILHAENALRYLRKSEVGSNPAWWATSNSEDTVLKQGLEESFKNFNQQARTIENNATIPIYRKTVLEHAQKTGASGYAAAKDLGLDELTIYKAGIPSQLAAQAKLKYASSDKSIPESQFIENEINIATDPNYGTSGAPLFPKPKQEAANVPAQSSLTVLNTLGTGSYEDKVALIGSELKKTRDPIQIAFLESELKKAEQSKPVVQASATTTSPQNKSGTPLQQIALLPNVNKLISTPLDIVTNPSTIKTKPVADPLRQAALEQTPVATSNTAQPSQLTPAEVAQGETTEQAALSRLIGAKLEEKQALVRKVFPNTSLTPINKPNEPLSNNSIPLIQSMFKLPVATDNTSQPKSINKAATAEAKEVKQSVFPDTPLKQLAKAATPVPSPLIPVESQNAFRVKENNLALDFRTGKGTPTKDPVPMPKVTWKEPVQVVAINPIFAQLPQYTGVVTYVGDADTLLAKSNKYTTKGRENESSNVECRIDSVDAPETPHPEYGKKGQPYGEEAAKILQQMVLNKEVSIRVTKPTDGESNYGRDVCQIEVSGKDVSVELLRAGAAWLYQYKDKRTGEDYNRYGSAGIQLEQQARDAKRGLWALPNPQNPYDFRQQEKRK